MQKLRNCVRSEGFLGARFTGSTKYNHFSWAYYVSNDPKIIVMGNGHDVLRAFLLEPLSRVEFKGHTRIDEPPRYNPKYR